MLSPVVWKFLLNSQLCHFDSDVVSLEDHFAVGDVLGELAKIVAGYSLDRVII